MMQVDLYLDAAERANTRRSYASAIQHFEVEWGGLLPATIDSIARYLAAYAESLSLNTLKHRISKLTSQTQLERLKHQLLKRQHFYKTLLRKAQNGFT